MAGTTDSTFSLLNILQYAMSPGTLVTAVFSGVVTQIPTLLQTLATSVHTWRITSVGGSVDMLAEANGVMPISEGIAVLVALLALRVACSAFRIIKSWIPTVA